MTRLTFGSEILLAGVAIVVGILLSCEPSHADPSKYPQFAQQTLPPNLTPAFISIDELLGELKTERKPLVIDVRTDEEFREAHILGAISAPLAQFNGYLQIIPKDGLVVLY